MSKYICCWPNERANRACSLVCPPDSKPVSNSPLVALTTRIATSAWAVPKNESSWINFNNMRSMCHKADLSIYSKVNFLIWFLPKTAYECESLCIGVLNLNKLCRKRLSSILHTNLNIQYVPSLHSNVTIFLHCILSKQHFRQILLSIKQFKIRLRLQWTAVLNSQKGNIIQIIYMHTYIII